MDSNESNLYISKIRLGEDYNIRDLTSGYVTTEVNDLVNYTNNTKLASHYQIRLQAGTHAHLTPGSIEVGGENIPTMVISSDYKEYNLCSSTDDGLMSAAQYVKLRDIATRAERNTISTIAYNNEPLTPDANRVVNIEVPITEFAVNGIVQTITNNQINLLVNGTYSINNKIATMNDVPTVNNGILSITKGGEAYGQFSANSADNFALPLADIAFSGSYTDLSDQPIIPDVYNGELNISVNSTPAITFSANSESDVDLNLIIPDSLSDLDFTSIDGYDSSATQTLQHINGVLTWV